MATRQRFYWLLTGGLVSFGFLGILSIGLPFLLVGIGMLIYAIIRGRFNGFWAFLVGFGALPALILAIQFVMSPLPTCTVTPTGISYQSSQSSPGTTGGCYPPGYYTMVIFFGVIALLGIIWPLLTGFFRRFHS
ncbi:MAG TPA: hypothetical protein VFA41_24410 [Ktedonobacteraceae bacterium]|nr:hypothetical protein [Ktedonobacteraceae bacterium]